MLSDVISSPFFDKHKPDPRYLTYLSKWHWPYTCRCTKYHGRVLDLRRAMFVCDTCFLPSGFLVEDGHFCGICLECGHDFVVWNNSIDPGDFCLTHGGTNCAKPGQRNIIEPADYIPEVD